jgi:hypothetical protein|tara:strand:- start:481 stop:807 length:327 start_codon:yes stop_codon:yes gene_type:complete
MIKIVLEPARNGVIKRVINDNHGGGKEQWTSIDVFESNDDHRNKYEYIMRFFYELCDDLGLHRGNKFEKEVIKTTTEWGTHYEPNQKEIESKIKELQAEIDLLTEWKQ